MMPWRDIYTKDLPANLAPPYDFRHGALPPEAFSMQHYMQCGLSKAAAKQAVKAMQEEKVVLSSGYQVNIIELGRLHPKWPPLVWFSIKRRDKAAIVDRSILRDIKLALAGPEAEGFELYPAESRLVDTANQYHLYLTEGPAPVPLATHFEPGRSMPLTGELQGLVAQLQTVGPSLQSLRLTDVDGQPVGDWRLRQQAKNQIFSPECEGAEVFASSLRPPEETAMDQILVLLDPTIRFPFGFKHRYVTEPSSQLNKRTGAVQRDFGTRAA